MGCPTVFLAPRVCRRGVGAQYATGETSQQRVLISMTPGHVHNLRARGVNPNEGTFMDTSQCTSAPHREPDLALSGTHRALLLEDLDNLHYGALKNTRLIET